MAKELVHAADAVLTDRLSGATIYIFAGNALER
jgi:hypothetical protein